MTGSDSLQNPSGECIWITRTEPAAGRLAGQCRALHLTVQIQPLLRIEPLAPDMPSERFDIGICLSVHAARCLAGQRHLVRRWVCIGEATAAELAGVLGVSRQSIESPELATSEALVALLGSQLEPGNTVLLACGIGGRGILEPALIELGGEVTRLELYRRAPSQLIRVPDAIAVEIASAEALEVLAGSGWNKRRPMVVASDRLADVAATKGFENVHNSGGAEPARVAAALAEVVRACRPNV